MQCIDAGSGEIRMVMPATLQSIDEVDGRLCAFLAQAGAVIDRFAVRILLREALLNAVMHGSGEDASRSVDVHWRLDDQGLTMTVRDDGEGFPWREVWESPDVLLESGRGIPLMKAYASEVVFNEAGNQVTLFRSVSP